VPAGRGGSNCGALSNRSRAGKSVQIRAASKSMRYLNMVWLLHPYRIAL
jgi:hypothetical protein